MERVEDQATPRRLRQLAETLDARDEPRQGEAEADLVSRSVGTSGALPSPLTDSTSGEARAAALTQLHQSLGNAYVQRVIQTTEVEEAAVAEVHQRAGAGHALETRTQDEISGHFGGGLEHVRVHTDSEAARMADELHAEAFTVGKDVFFGEGRYDPASAAGKGLIAHELTHVGQQVGFTSQVQRQATATDEEEQKRRAAAMMPGKRPEEEETS